MYFAYVDETGISGNEPVTVMAGVVANAERLTRTQTDLNKIFEQSAVGGEGRELKCAEVIRGKGPWSKIDGNVRRNFVENILGWVADRRHDVAMAAVVRQQLTTTPPPCPELKKPWAACGAHIALQLQRAHQSKPKNKGRTVLVVDNNPRELDAFAGFVMRPPSWTDDYYGRPSRQEPLSMLIDTPFAVKSHHIGLIQVADLIAGVLRLHTELADFDAPEAYPGQAEHVSEWVGVVAERLLPKSHRWPARSTSECAQWYRSVAPPSLLAL